MASRIVSVVWLGILALSLDCSTDAPHSSRAVARVGSTPVRFAYGEAARAIPFRLVDDQIVFPVRVNDALDVDMVLDTGFGFGGALLLDMRLGQRLGLRDDARIVPLGGGGTEAARSAALMTGGTLGLPGVTFERQLLLVVRDSTSLTHWPVEGILGKAMMGCVVEIDFQNRVLNLSQRLPDSVSTLGEACTLAFENGIPVARATIRLDSSREVPVTLLVDTGTSDALLLRAASHPDLTPRGRLIRPSRGVLAEGMNGPMRGSVGRVKRLTLGSLVLDDVVTCFVDEKDIAPAVGQGIHGVIGNEVLQRFNVVFDYAGGRMFLRPGQQSARAFEFDMAGLVLQARRDGTLAVLDVVAESPAGRAGAESGDILIAIDGQDVRGLGNERTLGMLRTPGRTIALTLNRAGRQMTRRVTLARLI